MTTPQSTTPLFSELKEFTTGLHTALDFDKDGQAFAWEYHLGQDFNDHFSTDKEKQQAYERLLAIVDEDDDGKISRDEIDDFQVKVGNGHTRTTFTRNIFDYIPDAILNGQGVATKGRLTLGEGETVNQALGLETLDDVFAALMDDGNDDNDKVKRNDIRNFINTSLKAKGIEPLIEAGHDIEKLIRDAGVHPHKRNFTKMDLENILTHVENTITPGTDLFSFINDDSTV